jgi:putative thioredoxin
VDKLLSGTDDAQMIAEALSQAEAASQKGDIVLATEIYAAVLQQEPENIAAIAGMARCYLANGEKEQAEGILAMVPEAKKNDPVIKGVRLAIEMMADAPPPSELDAALSAVMAAPGDYEKRFELAEQYAAAGKYQDAVDHLLIILSAKLDWEGGKAKDKLLKIFEAAGPTEPVTIEGRRRLSSLMFA